MKGFVYSKYNFTSAKKAMFFIVIELIVGKQNYAKLS